MLARSRPEGGPPTIFGSTDKSVTVRSTGAKRCPTCNANQPHNLICHYKVFHICWFSCHIIKRTYRDECSACHRGPELDTAEVERTLTRRVIPLMDRIGLLLFGYCVVLLGLLLGLLSGYVKASK